MKNNRELILSYLKEYTEGASEGVSTKYLSECLNMQRSNLSRILNELVKEGLAVKNSGRPVLYKIKKDKKVNKQPSSCFQQAIGSEGSLKGCIQLAKAALIYPIRSLHTLLIAPGGAGKEYFAGLMFQFAVENRIFQQDALFIKLYCSDYEDRPEQLGDVFLEYLEKAENGMLYIANAELMPSEARSGLFHFIEQNYQIVNDKQVNLRTVIICGLDTLTPNSIQEMFKKKFTVSIQLPTLKDRPFSERYEFIKKFFIQEVNYSSRTIRITSEILIGLLLYNCQGEYKQLEKDIKMACANAYVRELHSTDEEIKVMMSDFPYYVRNGLLSYKNHRYEIKKIIDEHADYTFDASATVRKQLTDQGERDPHSIYDWIEDKTAELKERGIYDGDISTIISVDIENEFKEYRTELSSRIVNKEQLRQMIPEQIIDLVNEFLSGASRKFKRVYPVSVFYSLCLHLNSMINENEDMRQRLSNEKIMEMIGKHKEEYFYAMKFCTRIENEYKVRFPIDETIYLTMFIKEELSPENERDSLVVLVAMHGDNVASSIVRTVQSLGGSTLYAYDLELNKSNKEAYEDLKELVLRIHRGHGILVIYDMGSLKNMFNMLMEETGIEIRMIEIPLFALVLNCAWKTTAETDIASIQESILSEYRMFGAPESKKSQPVQDNEIVIDDNYKSVFEHLNSKLDNVDMNRLGVEIILALSNVQEKSGIQLTLDQRIGLLVHISCAVDRLLDRERPVINIHKDEIILKYRDIYEIVKASFKYVETLFGIAFDDNEYAYILSIICQFNKK
ncbi:PRD domain-containing protein [Lachnospiraceae bacterium 54-53]